MVCDELLFDHRKELGSEFVGFLRFQQAYGHNKSQSTEVILLWLKHWKVISHIGKSTGAGHNVWYRGKMMPFDTLVAMFCSSINCRQSLIFLRGSIACESCVRMICWLILSFGPQGLWHFAASTKKMQLHYSDCRSRNGWRCYNDHKCI